MTYDQIVAYYGTEAKAAKKLGFTPQALNLWKHGGGVPHRTQELIELKTRGKLKADK